MRHRTDADGQVGDAPLARLAAAQHGVLATRQMKALGLGDHVIGRLRIAGWLHPLHRGVYAVGHPRLSERGRWMAAVLACGPNAVLSHHQAAALHGLLRASPSLIHVTAPGRHRVDGVRCHRAKGLRGRPRIVVDGIPVTSVERTFLDMAAVLSEPRLRSLLETAQRSGRYDHARTLEVIERANGHRGVGALTAAIAELHDEPPAIRSGLEQLALELIRAAHLPEPAVNTSVEGEVVDLSWPEYGLVVEIDSWRYHQQRSAFESDRRRGNQLTLGHLIVLRFTDRDLRTEPRRFVAEIRQAIRTCRSAGAAASGR